MSVLSHHPPLPPPVTEPVVLTERLAGGRGSLFQLLLQLAVAKRVPVGVPRTISRTYFHTFLLFSFGRQFRCWGSQSVNSDQGPEDDTLGWQDKKPVSLDPHAELVCPSSHPHAHIAI